VKRDERIPRSQVRLDLVDEQHDPTELTVAGDDGGLDVGPKFLIVPGERADIHDWAPGGRHGLSYVPTSTSPKITHLLGASSARVRISLHINDRSTIAALMPEWSAGGDAMTSRTAPVSC
jgi:hypothetical protein